MTASDVPPQEAILLELVEKPARKAPIYRGKPAVPVERFNRMIHGWLKGEVAVVGHQPPKAFAPIRVLYDKQLEELLASGRSPREAHRTLLSSLTPMLLGIDISAHLHDRLSKDLINESGFRTALAQGAAKNNGENFVNVIVYALAQLFGDRDDVLVEKGTPPMLREALTLHRRIELQSGVQTIAIPIECDFCVFSREEPNRAVVVSAKTRLKEVFHVATMWKMLFDAIGDEHCESKWDLKSNDSGLDAVYCFATADMVPPGGTKTQGPDVEREAPRNLIAMDASFFDYVFVSKPNIGHVARDLVLGADHKEALFHELGCLVDLIEQKFEITL